MRMGKPYDLVFTTKIVAVLTFLFTGRKKSVFLYTFVFRNTMKMKPLFICYPRCSTCQKALKWLQERGIEVEVRYIVQQNPSEAELEEWIDRSGLAVNRFFNTSGLRYKALNLKEKVRTAPREELIRVLSTDGMLVKRPLLIASDKILVGFREPEWAAALSEKR